MPERVAGFFLRRERISAPNQERAFSYENEKTRRSFSVWYDNATKEYIGKVVVGLTEFCDIDYIAAKAVNLEELIQERLQERLLSLANFAEKYAEHEFLQKKILQWAYIEKLPAEICGFELFIAPNAPVKVVNGSYIIIDYSDFERASALIIYYNIFRDEFFGELKIKRTPVTTTEFDAKTLPELAEKLKLHLNASLSSLREKCGE
ncbi:MAG: hypothetical protein LBR56_09150 [Sporomusaceae bacterium]|nr:hypothetical protein [Sporomusaceae bacterium]